MDVKLQEAMAEIITSTAETANSFIIKQMPDVIKQILTWEMVSALFFVGLGITIGLLSIPFFKLGRHYRNKIRNCSGDEELCFIFFFLTGISAFIGNMIFFVNMHTVLYIWIAPKAYLIEYASKLAK